MVNGTISILQKLRPKDSKTDLLFVGTERFEYFTLAWNPETSQLHTIDPFTDPGERHMRDSQSQDRCLVDPSGRYLAMHLWEGVLTMLRLGERKNKRGLAWMDQVRLSELFIKASTFLYTETGHPKIAFLYQSRADSADAKLATYRMTIDDRNTEASKFDPDRDREIDTEIPDSSASILIPVRKVEEEVKRHNVRNVESAKAHIGGLLVVGETRLLYIDEVTKATVQSALKQASIFVAWAEYNETNYFLADDYGNLHLLTLVRESPDSVVVTGMEVNRIGKTSRASHLVFLGGDMLFVASHYGDSQLFRLDFQNEDVPPIQLVQTLANIGPILDFAIMDMGRGDEGQQGNEYSSGQARIVTCSGVHKDGSLRSVRSGVGLEDVGILADLEHCRGLFSLKTYEAPKTNILAASFLTETRVFKFDPQGEVEELNSFAGMTFDQQTLLARYLSTGQILQVTPAAVTLLDAESGLTIDSWTPGAQRSIISASGNNKSLLLSVDGTELVLFSIDINLRLVRTKEIGHQDQIACIHVPPLRNDLAVVGFWSSGTVSIIDLPSLEPMHGEQLRTSPDDASIPRDLALVTLLDNMGGGTLFVAMQDGNVITFNLSENFRLTGRKRVILGMRQARFHLLPQPDAPHIYSIFATTEHPSLIYGSEGRIVYSAVTAEEATYICPFDTEAFPDCIVLATDNQLKISHIDRERRTHVKPLPMNEMVRRIAYSPKEKVFGLGCIRRELVNGEEIVESSFKLVDEVIFDRVGKTFPLGVPSRTELVECVVRAELRDSYGNPAERFLVGTSFLPDPDYGPGPGPAADARGRLLVLGVDADRNPYLVLSHDLKGACRCLAVLGEDAGPNAAGLIVAGLTKTVVVCRYDETSSTTAELTRLASYRPSSYPAEIAVRGSTIAVADLMKSISLVEYVPAGSSSGGSNGGGSGEGGSDDGPRLVEHARHFSSVWATAVGSVEEGSWLEADAQGNLMVLRRNVEGVTAEDKRRMEVTSEINLGEMVNRIRTIDVETTPGAMIVPKAFLGTVEGGIYMFGTVAPHVQDLLLRFQSRLADVLKTAGDIEFRTYRAFRNAEREGDGPFRFVDGELLEKFLDVDETTQEAVCKGLGPTVEDMRNLVEELRRMH
ncbi:mono-functional DNA-alkylating methyl methanesulfonate N-term-domain-containing protein [Chaetomium tenue]|uniref:Mono-functional DNA-alkylating methyl methanesulfonate N-term-domain-containing protein n=1 Tax=Chaetomium tenue TaxID=1854479 RepID=A0ACB7P8R4_9PEZI|nr:mono-functional DNA-alkylating methyl methanesulfonate N-term-domain-containing protein [Chaetomium globosum]